MPTHDPEQQQPPSRQERLRTQWGRFSVRRRFSSSRSAGVREASGAGSPVREAVAAFERRFSSSRSAGVREASGAGSPVREAVAAFEAVSAAARTAHEEKRSQSVSYAQPRRELATSHGELARAERFRAHEARDGPSSTAAQPALDFLPTTPTGTSSSPSDSAASAAMPELQLNRSYSCSSSLGESDEEASAPPPPPPRRNSFVGGLMNPEPPPPPPRRARSPTLDSATLSSAMLGFAVKQPSSETAPNPLDEALARCAALEAELQVQRAVAAQACERAGRLEALLLAVQRLVAMPEIAPLPACVSDHEKFYVK